MVDGGRLKTSLVHFSEMAPPQEVWGSRSKLLPNLGILEAPCDTQVHSAICLVWLASRVSCSALTPPARPCSSMRTEQPHCSPELWGWSLERQSFSAGAWRGGHIGISPEALEPGIPRRAQVCQGGVSGVERKSLLGRFVSFFKAPQKMLCVTP